MQVDDAVAGATKRAVGEENVSGESAELSPEYAVGLLAVLEHPRLPLQAAIKSKDQSRPKRARDDGQSREDAGHWDYPRNA
jgi:hypothetical protein